MISLIECRIKNVKVPCIALDMDYGNPAPASFLLKTGDAGGAGGGLSNLSTDCLAAWYRVINLQRWEIAGGGGASTDQMASILGNGQWRGQKAALGD